MKIVHAADLHVDSPLVGLDRYDGAPAAKLRAAPRRALENLVALCLEESAAALLLAGDVFDGSWKDYSTGLFFATQMARLREANIPVVLVRGNHDAASVVVRALRLPDNVRELSAKKPETIELPSADIAVHGQSFAQRAVTEDLAARYPAPVPGAFNVGLLHTCLEGREGHERYAPTTLEALRAKGYDYWALGHVHAREVLSTAPWIVFPGNLQGRHARETGPKGATVITVEDGVVAAVTARDLDVVRWEVVSVDLSPATDAFDAVDLAREALAARVTEAAPRTLAARVVLHGASRANAALRRDDARFTNELRVAAATELGDALWLERVILRTRSTFDLAALRGEASAAGHLARRLGAMRESDDELASLAGLFTELERRLPSELREGDGALALTSTATLRALVDDVEQTLLPRLLEGAEEPSS